VKGFLFSGRLGSPVGKREFFSPASQTQVRAALAFGLLLCFPSGVAVLCLITPPFGHRDRCARLRSVLFGVFVSPRPNGVRSFSLRRLGFFARLILLTYPLRRDPKRVQKCSPTVCSAPRVDGSRFLAFVLLLFFPGLASIFFCLLFLWWSSSARRSYPRSFLLAVWFSVCL